MEFILALLGSAVAPTKNYDGFFGFLGIVFVLLTVGGAWIFSNLQLSRTGRQKVAEARLKWSDEYHRLVIELYAVLAELDRLMKPGRLPGASFRRWRMQLRAHQIAIKLLVMVNPGFENEAALAEGAMEADLGERLARVGVGLDMEFIRKHRDVVKHNWRRVKKEY